MSRARVLDSALVVVGGLLYTAAFPPHDCAAGAWVALVPLLAVVARTSVAGAFVAGAAYGAVFFTGIVAWVVDAVSAYFSTGVVGALAFSAVICVLYVSIYVGLFAVAARRLLAASRWRALLAIPALWVGYELARARLLTGLPWELLGHSQWRHTTLIQIADLGGVYALSFLVAAVNVGVYLALRRLACTAHPRALARAAAPLAAALALVAGTLMYGNAVLSREGRRSPAPTAVVAIAQANLPTQWRWERSGAERSLLAYSALTRQTIATTHPDLLVWPEYAVTLYPDRDAILLPALTALARSTSAGLVFGAPRIDEAPPHVRYFNSAYHLAPDGTLLAYDKLHLVPFAEYRPASLGEAVAAAEPESEFTAGTESTVFPSAAGRLGVLICYEVIFPELARALVRGGAEVLLNLANDGWLDSAGRGAGAQHLSMAVFRAVENRRYVARAASSGISGFIDPLGRPFALLAVGTRGVTTGEIEPRRDLTIYTRYGDVFAGACALLGVAVLAYPPRRRGRR
jgi:apolipoprotein N-acyltransferase